jgi:hypothetical protein
MSYSRWSNSIWYTYWTSSYSEDCEFKLPTKRLKDNQFFEICDFGGRLVFSYKEISEDVNSCLLKVVEHHSKEKEHELFSGFDENKIPIYTKTIIKSQTFTDDELNELKGYMLEFKNDIDNYFKWKEFFYIYWFIPIKYYFRTKTIKIKK